jgi:hypothetical protein
MKTVEEEKGENMKEERKRGERGEKEGRKRGEREECM